MDPRMDNNPAASSGDLPPDLAQLAERLDALGAKERAGASPGLEDRLFVATRARLGAPVPADLAPQAELVDALASGERAAAGPAFEDRIFIATRTHLGSRAAAAAPAAMSPAPRVHVTPAARCLPLLRLSLRQAAAVAVIGAGAATWVSLRPDAPAPGPSAPDHSIQLALQVDRSVETLETLFTTDWTDVLPDGFEDISREVDTLAQRVRGDWFQPGELADEEAL